MFRCAPDRIFRQEVASGQVLVSYLTLKIAILRIVLKPCLEPIQCALQVSRVYQIAVVPRMVFNLFWT